MIKSILISFLTAILVVGAVAAYKFVPRELSYDECSDIYRHYADMQLEGVRVTFVKDKLVGDTVRVPVTLLEAESDRGWELLDSLFGYSENINKILNDPGIPEVAKQLFLKDYPDLQFHLAHRETPEKKIEPNGGRPDDVMVYVQAYLRCVSIFETADDVVDDKVNESKLIELEEEDARRQKEKAIIQQSIKDLKKVE